MVITPQIFTAKVMHKRFFPKENAFEYGIYYLALPLPAPPIPGRLSSFHLKDVGQRDGSDPTLWIRNILAEYGLEQTTKKIMLITMPRILGYVFNPVSFYLCFDNSSSDTNNSENESFAKNRVYHNNNLKAVLCEVHNTFGEQHSYLCANADHTPIRRDSWLTAAKVFHVSPFLPRTGHYQFRFDVDGDKLGIWIHYYDADNKKQLITSLIGTMSPLTEQSLRKSFWQHPLVAIKAILLIHWQALKLIIKGITHIRKPEQYSQKITATRSLNIRTFNKDL